MFLNCSLRLFRCIGFVFWNFKLFDSIPENISELISLWHCFLKWCGCLRGDQNNVLNVNFIFLLILNGFVNLVWYRWLLVQFVVVSIAEYTKNYSGQQHLIMPILKIQWLRMCWCHQFKFRVQKQILIQCMLSCWDSFLGVFGSCVTS